MSKFILGTAQFGLKYGINNKSGQPTPSNVFHIFDAALEHSIHILDTAQAYGNAHEIIGQYHNSGTQKFKINTKFSSVKPELFINQVANACDTLAINQIDTCFYHNFKEYKSRSLKRCFDKLLHKGFVKNVGVSIYTNEEFEEVINDLAIHVIQIPFNIFDNFSKRGELILRAKAAGKILQVRSIFLQGLFFTDLNNLKGNTIELKEELIMLQDIAEEYFISVADLCIQYACYYQEIDHVIIGVDTLDQLKSNLNSCTNTLSPDIIDRINEIHVKNTSLLYPYNWK